MILKVLDGIRSWWPLILCLAGIIGTVASIPTRLNAVEKRTEAVESRQQTVEQYIQAIEEQKQLIKQAPPGWIWSEKEEQYVQDPYYKPKKVR